MAAVALGLATVACSSGPTRAPSLLADFAQAARDAGTVAFEMTSTQTWDDGAGAREFTTSAEGRFDINTLHGEFTMDVGDIYERTEADWPGDRPSFPSVQHVLLFGDRWYLEISDEHREWYQEAPPEARWMRARSEEAAITGSFDLFSPLPDPGSYFATLQEIAVTVEPKDAESIRGVATTRYRVVVDMKAAEERVPEQQREWFRQFRKEVGNRLPMSVWIGDDDALLYRQRVPMSFGGAEIVTTTDFFDYGRPVEIQEPSEDEVWEPDEQGGTETRRTFSCTGSSVDEGSQDC